MKPKISIIVPTMGRPDLLKKWIDNLHGLHYKNIEIVIIDNNSDNELHQFIIKNYPNILIIKPEKNIGVTPAFYVGAIASSGEVLHFSNDDVFYEKDYFNKIIEELEKDEKIGIIGGTMLDRENKMIQGPCKRNFELTYYTSRKQKRKFSRFRNIKGSFDTAAIGGGQLTIKKAVLEKVGNWDPNLFMYAEEIDLALKVRKHNYKIRYVPSAVCYHLHSTQARDVSKSIFYICRNKLIVIKRHYENPMQTIYLINNLLFFYPRLILYRLFRPKKWPEIRFIIQGALKGIRYFVTNKIDKVNINIKNGHNIKA